MSTSGQAAPRTRRPPRSETRAAVLRAAAQMFGSNGFAQTSLDQVAAAAGLSRGAVYSNFASKDELFLALLRETVDERLRQVRSAMRAAPTADEQTRQAGRRMTGTLRQRPDMHLLVIEFWLRAARDPAVREQFMNQRHEIRAAIIEVIEEQRLAWGVELPMPSDQLAVGIIALFNGFGLEQLVDPDEATPELFGNLIAAMLQAPGPGAAFSAGP